MLHTRRQFGKLALAGAPAVGWLLRQDLGFAAGAKVDSKWAGVQVGMNVPYNFGGGNYMSGDEILSRCVTLGISGVELRAQPVELFLGSPEAIAGAAAQARGAGRGQAPQGGAAAAAEETRKWRLGVSMDKVKQFRTKYADAGVSIDIVKWDGIFTMADDEVDYCFELAKALGAKALSTEMSIDQTKRLGQFADKHKMPVGYHGHTAVTPAIWETAFSYAKYNYANVDLGHFIAGNNTSPVPFIKKYPDRITHVHVKDRKLNNGPNVEFGKGDTPVKEVLQLMRDNKWKFDATIEFEYPVPAGSDRMTEIAKTVEYCKQCLLA